MKLTLVTSALTREKLYVGDFPVTMIKDPDKSNWREKDCILFKGSKGDAVYYGEEGKVAGAWGLPVTLHL